MNIFFKFFLKFIKKNFVIIKGLIIFGNRLHKTITLNAKIYYK